MKPVLEICAGSLEDALAAKQGGADRIELNSALPLGGLSPAAFLVRSVKKQTGLKTIAMLRLRPGGFDYTDSEYEQMLALADELLDAGADGLAFGFLSSDQKICKKRTLEMARKIHSCGKEAVFHRAFDLCQNLEESLETLIECGIDRVLTSGGAADALRGIPVLEKLMEQAGGRIEILPGCGIRPENIDLLLERTHAGQVHASCSKEIPDPGSAAGSVDFSEGGKPVRKVCDVKAVRALRQALDFSNL